MNNIKSFYVIDKDKINGNIHIVGVGALGSMVAEQLMRLNLTSKIIVYDFDEVEEKNLNNQAYLREHIGMSKVDAMKSLASNIDSDAKLRGRVKKVDRLNTKSEDVVILAVDNFHARGNILKSLGGNPLVLSGGITSRGGNLEIVRGSNQYKVLGDEYLSLEAGVEYAEEHTTPCGSPISIYHRIRVASSLFCDALIEHYDNGEERNDNIIFDTPTLLFLTDNKLD